MNTTIHLRNGHIFRFGYVERVWSNGQRLSLYADLGERATVKTRLSSRCAGIDELTSFKLCDVAEVVLDDETSNARMEIVR